MTNHNYIITDTQIVMPDNVVVLQGSVDGVGVILNIPATQLVSAIDAPSFQAIVQPLMLAEHDRKTANATKPFVVPGAVAGTPTVFAV